MPRLGVGRLWFLHTQSIPRNGLRDRRGLEPDTDGPSPRLPRRALELHTRGGASCAWLWSCGGATQDRTMKWDGYPNLRKRPPTPAKARGSIQRAIRRAFAASGAEALTS